MVWPLDLYIPKQIGVNFMSRVTLACIGLTIKGMDAHFLHQGACVTTTDLMRPLRNSAKIVYLGLIRISHQNIT